MDLRNIYEYIAIELQSPENAKGQLDRLEKAVVTIIRVMYSGREIEVQLRKCTKL